VISLSRIFKPKVWLHNLSEIFIYGGLAAIFVPIMNIFSALMLLILISIYDMYAVWKSKHMVSLAKFTTESNVFAGLSIPYHRSTGKIEKSQSKKLAVKTEKVRNAILGGGDIGFPLLFAGAVMKTLMLSDPIEIGFLKALIIPVATSIALLLLFIKGDKNKFYPAMPFLTAGCLVGYTILMGVNYLI
jgi:presenilin-like A22 family membrane protease